MDWPISWNDVKEALDNAGGGAGYFIVFEEKDYYCETKFVSEGIYKAIVDMLTSFKPTNIVIYKFEEDDFNRIKPRYWNQVDKRGDEIHISAGDAPDSGNYSITISPDDTVNISIPD